MSSTELDRARKAAADLFDEGVVPLAEARRAAGRQEYFPLERELGATSYYDEPARRTMQPVDFELAGGGKAEGLVDALAATWTAQGEAGLAAMAPGLREIAEALGEEAAEGDGTISILCYTMF
jgi:hypothetical protein